MPSKKSKDASTRKLTKVSKGSFAITLPIELVSKLGWQEHQKLVIKSQGRHLEVKDWTKELGLARRHLSRHTRSP